MFAHCLKSELQREITRAGPTLFVFLAQERLCRDLTLFPILSENLCRERQPSRTVQLRVISHGNDSRSEGNSLGKSTACLKLFFGQGTITEVLLLFCRTFVRHRMRPPVGRSCISVHLNGSSAGTVEGGVVTARRSAGTLLLRLSASAAFVPTVSLQAGGFAERLS